MFRVELLCDDRQLAKVLHGLAGLILEDGFKVQPVVNAEYKNGRIKAVTTGTRIDLFAAWLAKSGLAHMTGTNVKVFLHEHGFKAGTVYQLIYDAKKLGLIKKAGPHPSSGFTVNLPNLKTAKQRKKAVLQLPKPTTTPKG